MTTIEEIFTEYPDSWLLCLPGYQQKTINELYCQLGDYEQVAQAWLTASMSTNVPFGAQKGHSIFYEKVLDEIEAFFSGDERYSENRLAILKNLELLKTILSEQFLLLLHLYWAPHQLSYLLLSQSS